MKRKTVLLTAVFLMMSLTMVACSPRLVGEAKAKEAGLVFINKVFDVNETEATVTLVERPGLSYVNGIEAHLGDEKPVYFYTIQVNLLADGNYRYYAEVNAVTGVAYRADKDPDTIVLTQEQQKQAEALGSFDDMQNTDTSAYVQEAINASEDWVRQNFERNKPILRIIQNNCVTDSCSFPKVFIDNYVVFIDGTIYNVEWCWPSMEITGFFMLNQDH